MTLRIHTTCLVTILSWALPSHFILPKFYLTRVSHARLVYYYFLKKLAPGLSLIYLGQTQEGMAELEDATRQKATDEHSVIDEAIRDGGDGYTVFSIVRLK